MGVKYIIALGSFTSRLVEELGRHAVFGGAIAVNLLRPPFRLRLFIKEVHKLGVLSISIIGVSGLAVGMVLSLQGYNTLVRFGAADALGSVVGLGLIREMGPVLTGLLMTGRAGSATTAEIGTMVASEQIDGLRMMSANPMHIVVAPRALAMVAVFPLLTAIFVVLGLFGGGLVGVGLMGLDQGTYISTLEGSIDFHEDVLGCIVKSLVFGSLVALISTYRGYMCTPNSAGVSAATTQGMVAASLSILISDYFITSLWGY